MKVNQQSLILFAKPILLLIVLLISLTQCIAQDITNKGLFTVGSSPSLFVNSITNESSSTLELKGTLKIAGNFTNNGTLNANTSTVDFIGTTTQNIQGSAINDQFYNLFISNGTGSVVFNKDLLINGNLTNHGTFNGNGKKVTINGSSLQTICGNSATGNTFYDLTIANSSVGFRLDRNIAVTNQLSMDDGDIDLNGNDIDLGTAGTIVNEADDKRIHGSSGNIIARNRDLGPPDDYDDIAGLGIDLEVLSGGNTPGITTIKRTYSNYGSTVDRSFDISSATNSDLNIIMTFNYFDNELNDTEENLTVFRSTDNGVTWTDQNGVVNAESNHVLVDSITGFSIWSASKNSNPPLPIDLLNFSGKVEGVAIRLDWTTVSETNNDYFTVERSKQGLNFEDVTNVDGAGNSNTTLNYRIYDENPLPGVSYYRLKQTDFDGNYQYSNIIPIQFISTATINVFPNPLAGTTLNIAFEESAEEEILVTLNNTFGETVYSKMLLVEQQHGFVTTIDLENRITPGLYYIIGSSKNEIFRRKLIVL